MEAIRAKSIEFKEKEAIAPEEELLYALNAYESGELLDFFGLKKVTSVEMLI